MKNCNKVNGSLYHRTADLSTPFLKKIEAESPDNTSEGEKDDKTEKNEGEGGGAFYYFKVYKAKPKAPKQSVYDEDEEEYEEETVNEDVDEDTSDDDEE